MGGLGWQELTILLIIVIIIFGVGKLPQIGSALGRSIKDFKSEAGVSGDGDEKQIETGSFERASSLTTPARENRDTVVVASGDRRERRGVRADEI